MASPVFDGPSTYAPWSGPLFGHTPASSGTPHRGCPPQALDVNGGRAIVKLASPTLAYVEYLETASQSKGGNQTFAAQSPVILRLTRRGTGVKTWQEQEIFRFTASIQTPQQAPGKFGTSNSQWQDLMGTSFDIGNIGANGAELHLVTKQQFTGSAFPDLMYFRCLDK